MTRKRITAAEAVAQLAADPQYVAMRQRQDEELQKWAQEWQRAEVPLVDDLRGEGFAVESVGTW